MDIPTSPPGLEDCLEAASPESHRSDLRDRAQHLLHEHGPDFLLDQLSLPHTTHPPHLLPHLARALLDARATTLSLHTCAASQSHARLSTGVRSLDALLGGGVPLAPGTLTELSGRAGAGKTQLALQLCVQSAHPSQTGLFPGSHSAIYACTEGPPPTARLLSLDGAQAGRHGLPRGSLSARVLVERPGPDAGGLQAWARVDGRAGWLVRRTGARLLVLDSAAALCRSDYGDDAAARRRHVTALSAALRALPGVTVVAVNQVAQAVDRVSGELDAVVPALGAAWSACVDTRVFLTRRPGVAGRGSARVLASSAVRCHDAGEPEAVYVIGPDGVGDE